MGDKESAADVIQKASTAVVVAPMPAAVAKAIAGGAGGEGTAAHEPPKLATTEKTWTIGGRAVVVKTEAGALPIATGDDEKKATADVFFVSYTEVGADPAQRPVMFCFNGGPGSSSVWLHLGAFGPRRVDFDGVAVPRPPFRLTDNAHSLLDLADLVFIDPVSTGYSRAKGEAKPFHGVEADIESVGEFIRLWVTRHGRWSSAKYLAGESYGTTRAAGLVGWLQSRHGMYFNGLVLVSCALQFQAICYDDGNDLPYVLGLPSFAATAWYHGRLEGWDSLDVLLAEVEAWAIDVYAPALLRGHRLPSEVRAGVVGRLAAYTGLSREFVERNNLRIGLHRFCKELLRARGESVGRLDSRFRGPEGHPSGEVLAADPSLTGIYGAFAASFNHYVHAELEYDDERTYEILSRKVRPWKFDGGDNKYLDHTELLREAMDQNPHLQVLAGSGIYDLATPYFGADYTFSHLGPRGDLAQRVRVRRYGGGHMMYLDLCELAALKADIAALIHETSSD